MSAEATTHLQVQGKGNNAIIEALTEAGALLKQEWYPHKYPYDWRTKQPTIFRATDQVCPCNRLPFRAVCFCLAALCCLFFSLCHLPFCPVLAFGFCHPCL